MWLGSLPRRCARPATSQKYDDQGGGCQPIFSCHVSVPVVKEYFFRWWREKLNLINRKSSRKPANSCFLAVAESIWKAMQAIDCPAEAWRKKRAARTAQPFGKHI
jgi:hypothetical protein